MATCPTSSGRPRRAMRAQSRSGSESAPSAPGWGAGSGRWSCRAGGTGDRLLTATPAVTRRPRRPPGDRGAERSNCESGGAAGRPSTRILTRAVPAAAAAVLTSGPSTASSAAEPPGRVARLELAAEVDRRHLAVDRRRRAGACRGAGPGTRPGAVGPSASARDRGLERRRPGRRRPPLGHQRARVVHEADRHRRDARGRRGGGRSGRRGAAEPSPPHPAAASASRGQRARRDPRATLGRDITKVAPGFAEGLPRPHRTMV